MASTPPDRHQLCYFCDESSQVKDPWLAVGGLTVRRTAIPRITKDLAEIKEISGKTGEVKWKNAKSFGGRVHRAYIDYLFVLIENRQAHFHVRFSEMAEYDHGLSGPRKKNDTVSKSYYQLLLHRPIRYYRPGADVWVYPDDGCCTDILPEKLAALCADGRKHFPDGGGDCIKAIEPRASASEPMLQLLDVTLGALACYRNARHLEDGYSPVKRGLAEYAFGKTKWPTITGSSAISNSRLNRWNVIPKMKRGQ